jgi:HEPN domain-containing protein
MLHCFYLFLSLYALSDKNLTERLKILRLIDRIKFAWGMSMYPGAESQITARDL